MNITEITDKLIGKKWLVEMEPALPSYYFINGKVNIMPSNENCDYIIHQVKENQNAYRIDIFKANVTEVWEICAIGDSYILLANQTSAKDKIKYRILKQTLS
jgi:hypothetical protein